MPLYFSQVMIYNLEAMGPAAGPDQPPRIAVEIDPSLVDRLPAVHVECSVGNPLRLCMTPPALPRFTRAGVHGGYATNVAQFIGDSPFGEQLWLEVRDSPDRHARVYLHRYTDHVATLPPAQCSDRTQPFVGGSVRLGREFVRGADLPPGVLELSQPDAHWITVEF
ncbi:MAG: hypothetical protein KF729_24370 [Sandaracinaceae bacterium]|nr:hypothetical protein [Sandaracinaceae bacterium]